MITELSVLYALHFCASDVIIMFLTHIYVWVTTVLFPPVTQPPPPNNTIQVIITTITTTRPGVNKVKPKGWFRYSLHIE